MKKKLMIILPVLLIVLGGAYKFALAKPAPAKQKIAGTVYVLPKDFLINLTDGKFAKLDVALVLKAAPVVDPAAASSPPEGYGALPQEAAVRDIVTNIVTDVSSQSLISRAGREKLKKKILRTILKTTDVEAENVLFTDVAVQ